MLNLLLYLLISLSTSPQFSDRSTAETYLSTLPLSPVEGIWEYPAEETAVMILADDEQKGRYNIYYLEGIDCRLYPGLKIGSLESSPSAQKFKISLCSNLSGGLPGVFQTGLATLSDQQDALYLEMPKIKISVNPSLVLPVLWNKLRLNLRIRTTDPLDKLPVGWIKTYPTYDLNGSTRPHIRYL